MVSAGLRETLGRMERGSGAARGRQHWSTIVSVVPDSGEGRFPLELKCLFEDLVSHRGLLLSLCVLLYFKLMSKIHQVIPV